jgi:hypothetical protein
MANPHVVHGSRFAVHSHALAGAVTIATWLTLCTGFGLEVAPARDPVARLYQMDAERDAMARQAARGVTASYTAAGLTARPNARTAAPSRTPVPGT